MKQVIVAGVSGGPDSSYLLHKNLLGKKGARVVAGHVNFGLRGTDSEKDQELVEEMARIHGIEKDILRVRPEPETAGGGKARNRFPAGFEKNARDSRYRFLIDLAKKVGAERIAVAHTADDQVETILMRVFEGAGIGGLKGIPRETGDGVVRPILDVWREDILDYLKKRKIPYRIDRSNFDTRFERNWVRNVLLPLLVTRYGEAVKKRIFTLGERFRELDDYLDAEASRWIHRNVRSAPKRAGAQPVEGKVPSTRKNITHGECRLPITLKRSSFTRLPTVLRIRILQRISFDRLGVAPNERLLAAMDRAVRSGGPSARRNIGKGWELVNRYEEARFVSAPVPGSGPGTGSFLVTSIKKISPAQAKRLAANGDAEAFDAAGINLPLTVRPLRAGDRIRPFGRKAEKKVKEILIDRKIPRDDRWGRPVVCDAAGAILWIPGVLRSAHAPVTPRTRKTALLRIRATK